MPGQKEFGMALYSNFFDDNNAEFDWEIELDQSPSELFAQRLAKATGISIWHARTALRINGVTGGQNV
jgi:hypothetical protein